ncbi:hypothetical protein [uncultured Nocardioides sp.]|uniref:hypothetical protein n=1 Tax=uncultured Nocardioides sp. TaxID=198441 RepID=UPI00261A11B3|nr:hypothetical protein [uncultured Nocardioides sp.]HRD62778.1 hypothetical protein [Nocardioides sp.]
MRRTTDQGLDTAYVGGSTVATASHQDPPTKRDGARFVGRVIPIETRGASPERNAFELGRDYQRGLVRQQVEALEAEVANLQRRVDAVEAELDRLECAR